MKNRTILPRPIGVDDETWRAAQKKHEAAEAKLAKNAGPPPGPRYAPVRTYFAEEAADLDEEREALRAELEAGVAPARAAEIVSRLDEIDAELAADREEEREKERTGAENSEGDLFVPVRSPYQEDGEEPTTAANRKGRRAFVTCGAGGSSTGRFLDED